MPAPGLNKAVVDIPLLALNQNPPDHAGPLGRLIQAKNVIVEKYVRDDVSSSYGGARIKTKVRNGFRSYTTNATRPTDATSVTIPWSSPQLLTSLGRQVLSVARSVPRVWNGTTWTGYHDKRVLTNKLLSGTFHTSQHTIQAPTNAVIDGTTCAVWTETSYDQGLQKTTAYIGFRDETEAWIIPPKVLYDPGLGVDTDDETTMARVRADTENSRFWTCVNTTDGIDSEPTLRVQAWNTSGALLDTELVIQNSEAPSTGFWDIILTNDGKLQLAQPGDVPDGTSDVNVLITTLTYSGTISQVSSLETEIKCSGPLAWLTNDLESDDPFCYLGTHLDNDGCFAYQILDRESEHEFVVGGEEDAPDSIIGWVIPSDDPDEPTIYLGFSMLAPGATGAGSGPTFDPQTRWSEVWRCLWGGTGTRERRNNSVIFVTRAFKIDDDYYAGTYYQSGSGLVQTSRTQDVTVMAGDYMIGAQTATIDINDGDLTRGAPASILSPTNGQNINTTQAVGAAAIASPDKVEIVSNPGGLAFQNSDPFVLKWTIAALSSSVNVYGSKLVISSGTTIPSAEGTWLILGPGGAGPNSVWYTTFTNAAGGTVSPGTFGSGGTASITSNTYYQLPTLGAFYDGETLQFLPGGQMVVSGNATGANNGTKTIDNVFLVPTALEPQRGVIGIVTGSEASNGTSFSAVISPLNVNTWTFLDAFGTDILSAEEHNLVIEGANHPTNNGAHRITDVVAPGVLETDTSASVVAEVFHPPLPTASIQTGQGVVNYLMKFQDLTLDYTYYGATVSITGAFNSRNDGTYKIIQINDDGTFIATPSDGHTNQISEAFDTDPAPVVTIIFAQAVQSVWQPCWFITPLVKEIKQAHCGRFEYMTAYADWRMEGEQAPIPPNMFLMGVSDPVRTEDGWRFCLPFRAQSFTSTTAAVSPSGQVIPSAITISQNTVGLRQFDIKDDPGLSLEQNDETILPGLMSARFTASGFSEDGIMVALERPYLIEQDEVTDPLRLTPDGEYIYQIVAEVTDENSDRIYSIPSPPLYVKLIGDNNSIKIGGRQIQALGIFGTPTDNVWGMTNHTLVGLSLYRTAMINGVSTTRKFKITNDLAVNGLSPITATNNSGFAFPDDFTWTYEDLNPDGQITTSEILYTDKGMLPRFPAPPFSCGDNWKNRPWVIGPDGSLWFGGERTEGDASWFFPAQRYEFNGNRAVQAKSQDNFMIVFMNDDSIMYIPAPAAFPDATGKNGTLPTPDKRPITNSCTGFACTAIGGIAYASTSGGLWLLRQDLNSVWFSSPVATDLDRNIGTIQISGLAVDRNQRILILTDSSGGFVYDQVAGVWSEWPLPTASAKLVTVHDGAFVIQDNSRVAIQDSTLYRDIMGATTYPIAPDLTFADLNFANIRGLKKVWEFQVTGTYKGPHRLNVELEYPDDQYADPVLYDPFTPDSSAPYIYPFNPDPEEATVFQVRLYADFTGVVTPGDSFELELLSAEVGTEPKAGISKTTSRIVKS